MLETEKIYKNIEKLCSKCEAQIERVKQYYASSLKKLNVVNENSLKLIQKQVTKEQLLNMRDEIENITLSLSTKQDKLRKEVNPVLQFVQAEINRANKKYNNLDTLMTSNGYNLTEVVHNSRNIIKMQGRLADFEKKYNNLLDEIIISFMAANLIFGDKLKMDIDEKNKYIVEGQKNIFGKFVFAKDITTVIKLVKNNKLETKISRQEIDNLASRVDGITTDTPVPILLEEYKTLKCLFKSAEQQKVDIPFLRSESQIRHLFKAHHNNKTFIFPELSENYDLEY